MDPYTRLTKAWLDNRYRYSFDPTKPTVYYGHEPIYGIGGFSEPNHARRLVRVFQLLRSVRSIGGTTLLDVGGSEGYFAQLCRELFGMTVMSVDLSAEACQRAAEIFGVPGASVDATALPFADASFDLVTCAETVEHLFEPIPAILELQRVARDALILSTEEWLGDPTERERELEQRRARAHGERNFLVDNDATALFAPFAMQLTAQALPDENRCSDDQRPDTASLRAIMLELVHAGSGDAPSKGAILTVRKPGMRERPIAGPDDAAIADHLLQRAERLHLIGAPTPTVPWPQQVVARCPACHTRLAFEGDEQRCRCGQHYRRRRGVFSVHAEQPPFRERIDGMLAARGGPAYPQQREDLLALAAKLALPFVRESCWRFVDPASAAAWEPNASMEPVGSGTFRVVGPDPWLQIHGPGCAPDDARFVKVEMAAQLDDPAAEVDVAEVRWILDGGLGHRDECLASVPVVPDGRLRTYHFEAPPSVRGELVVGMRFDPLTLRRGTVQLASIRLDRELR